MQVCRQTCVGMYAGAWLRGTRRPAMRAFIPRNLAAVGRDVLKPRRCWQGWGSYLRLIDFLHHSSLGLRVIKKKKRRLGVMIVPELSCVDDVGVGVWILSHSCADDVLA